MSSSRPYLQADRWSWSRRRLHGRDVVEWFRREGWSVQDTGRSERHAFVDRLSTPTASIRRVWHTPVHAARAASPIAAPDRAPLALWMQMDGEVVFWAESGAEKRLSAGSAYFHARPPAGFTTTRATARFDISLSGRGVRDAEMPVIADQSGSPTWSALVGVINAVMNAREVSDTRMLALYSQSIETLVEALWFESAPIVSSAEGDTFTRAMKLIMENASDATFTIEVLARMLGVTRAHVTRLFRQRGSMPSRALKRERTHRAQRMLAIKPSTPLEAVAQSCGFSSTRLLKESLKAPSGRYSDAALRDAS